MATINTVSRSPSPNLSQLEDFQDKAMTDEEALIEANKTIRRIYATTPKDVLDDFNRRIDFALKEASKPQDSDSEEEIDEPPPYLIRKQEPLISQEDCWAVPTPPMTPDQEWEMRNYIKVRDWHVNTNTEESKFYLLKRIMALRDVGVYLDALPKGIERREVYKTFREGW